MTLTSYIYVDLSLKCCMMAFKGSHTMSIHQIIVLLV